MTTCCKVEVSITLCNIGTLIVHSGIVERLNIGIIIPADLRQAQFSELVGFSIVSADE